MKASTKAPSRAEDAARMLAPGAQDVLLGRAWLDALAAAGEAGVGHMPSLVEAEMPLTDCRSIADIAPGALVPPRRF